MVSSLAVALLLWNPACAPAEARIRGASYQVQVAGAWLSVRIKDLVAELWILPIACVAQGRVTLFIPVR